MLTYVVAFLDEPPRSVGLIDRCDPVHFAVVRVRRCSRPRSYCSVQVSDGLRKELTEEGNRWWKLNEWRRETYAVDPQGFHITRHPRAEKLAILGNIVDERPVVDFYLDYPEWGVRGIKHWVDEYNEVLKCVQFS